DVRRDRDDRWHWYSLGALEEALPLVARHRLVEETLLGPRVVQIVVDHLVAEGLAGYARALELVDRLPERRGDTSQVGVLVRVPFELGRRLQLVVDSVEARSEHRREPEVRVHVRAGNSRLDPKPVPVPDQPESARPVVAAPCERRR